MALVESPRALPFALIAALLALSGCIRADATDPTTEEDETSVNDGGVPLPAFELDGCLDTGTSMDDPESRQNQRLPDGWRYNTFATPLAMHDILVCDRVAVGSFERSDVALLFETNYGPNVPDSCLDHASGILRANLVNGLWVSDAGLSEHLSSTMNYTVQTFHMDVDDARSAQLPRMHISWQVDNTTLADLEFHGTPSADSETATQSKLVYAWPTTDGGLGLLVTYVDDFAHPGIIDWATGEVLPPHHNPNPASDHWSGGASARDSNISSELFQFEDTLCEVER